MQPFRPKDGGGAPPAPGRDGERDFTGETRSNDTHRSTTDEDARLFRKSDGEASRLCFIGHVLMENRNGLAVGGVLTRARRHGRAVGGLAPGQGAAARPQDPGCGQGLRWPRPGHGPARAGGHAACGPERLCHRTSLPPLGDGRTTRHPGYALSQRKRKRIEEIFGWPTSAGGCRQTPFRGLERVGMAFTMALAADKLIRIPKLLAQAA